MKRTVLAYESFQSFALDQLHCVIAVSAILRSAEMVNSSNVWMPQRGRGAGFTEKALAYGVCVPICRNPGNLDDFQSDLSTQDFVHGEIGRPHGAVTEFPVKAVCVLLYLEVTEDYRGRLLGFDD